MLRTASSVVAKLAFAVLAASWSLPAPAVVVTGGFSGQIFLGSDFGDFFGTGGDLADQPITGTFRYDTLEVPPASSTGANFAIYSDPTFATDFLDFTISINGRTYAFGAVPAPPGIQSIEVIDDTDQLLFDYQRFGIGASESIALRFISDIDFLTGTAVPTEFDFLASGIGLTPGGTFSFDLPTGAFASASFTIDTGFARVATVAEPSSLYTVALAIVLGAGALLRRRASMMQ
jgi:hypothetical protein